MARESDARMRDHVTAWMAATREAMEEFRVTHTQALIEAARLMAAAVRSDGQVVIFGNGGSAADAQHMAAEMVGRMLLERRRPLRAVALTTDTSALTAIANDYSYDRVFEIQVRALGRKNDVAVAFSTSGNSPNVVRAADSAKAIGMKVIGLTGRGGGKLKEMSDVSLNVSRATHSSMIQETHAIAIHLMVDLMDRFLLGRDWVEVPD